MSGYPINIDHRLGGHDGIPTEWELSIPGANPIACEKLKALKSMRYEHFCCFTLEADRHAPGMCITEGAPAGLVWKVAAFLTAWPSAAGDAFESMLRLMQEGQDDA